MQQWLWLQYSKTKEIQTCKVHLKASLLQRNKRKMMTIEVFAFAFNPQDFYYWGKIKT